MKSLLRKINRGVILSVAVILGIAAYYGVIAIRNAPERRGIEEIAKAFGEIYEEGYTRPASLRDFVDYPKEQTEKDAKELKAKLEKIYVKDADGIQKWVSIFTTENEYKSTAYQYYETYEITYKRLYSLKITGDTATASADYRIEWTVRSDPSAPSSWGSPGHTGTASFKLEKTGGKWRATAISADIY